MIFCIIKNRATCYITCFPIPANAQIRVFAASGGVCGAYAVAPLPCYRNRIHKIRMYPGRGVLHTPPKRFRRKRRDSPMHKNDHSPPPAAFVGRMQYAPTLPENLKSKNKNESGTHVGTYCIRPTNILSRNILRCKICVFATSGGICGAYAIRPYRYTGIKSEKAETKNPDT